jgi:hypothetical protein
MPQSLSQLYVHLAFSTQHRERLLLARLRAPMHAYLATVLTNSDSPAIQVGGTSYRRPPKRVLFEDYKPEALKSALYTEAKARINEIENRTEKRTIPLWVIVNILLSGLCWVFLVLIYIVVKSQAKAGDSELRNKRADAARYRGA